MSDHQKFDAPAKGTSLQPNETRTVVKRVESVKLTEQLIAPLPNPVVDLPLELKEVSTFQAIGQVSPDVVMCFEVGEPLRCFLQYAESLLGVRPVVLTALPNAVYTPEFDQLTWSYDRVSYTDVVSDMDSTDRAAVLLEKQAGARAKPPKRQQTLEKPREKHFDKFVFDDLKGGTGGAGGRTIVKEDDDGPDHGA